MKNNQYVCNINNCNYNTITYNGLYQRKCRWDCLRN